MEFSVMLGWACLVVLFTAGVMLLACGIFWKD